MAREAVSIAAATNDLSERHDAQLRLAEVICLAGRISDARAIAE